MTDVRKSIPVTLGEVCEPFELAPSLEVFEYLMCMTALTVEQRDGVRWHCRLCRHHSTTSTLLLRPPHCGQPMEIESWIALSQVAAAVPLTVDLRGIVKP